MDDDAALEELRSILCDLPAGSHALVRVELSQKSILAVCHETARDADEALLVHEPLPKGLPASIARRVIPFDHERPDLWAPRLRAAARTARGTGRAGAFLAVLPESRIKTLGAASHLASELHLGPEAPLGSRVVCFYTDEAVRSLPLRPALDTCHSSSFKLMGGSAG